jgi:hypothetical protein
LGSIREKLQKRWENYQKQQQEKKEYNRQLAIETKREERIGYAKGAKARARIEGYEKGKHGGGGLGGTLNRIGTGFTRTYEEMYPEYASHRTARKTSKKKKQKKRDPYLDMLGF